MLIYQRIILLWSFIWLGPKVCQAQKNSGLLNILQQSVCFRRLRAKLHLTLARRWSNLWDTWKDWKDEAENHCRVGFCWIVKHVRCNRDVCPELMSRTQRIVQRGWLILIPHEDKFDDISPINILFWGCGGFWSLMKIKLMLLARSAYWS